MTAKALARLERGVELEDGPARVHTARRLGSEQGGTALELVLVEGRKRQIRRMCEAVGYPVAALVRLRIGAVELGDLPAGAVRELTPAEVRGLRGEPS
jgi:pseudouridine synthase